MLWLQPDDLATSTEHTPIRAYLDNGGHPVAQSLLSAVASELELRSYPDLEVVATEATTYNPKSVTSGAGDGEKGKPVPEPFVPYNDRAYVELHPEAPLPSAWYVLSLKTLPAGLQPGPWSAPEPPVGAYAARFHTGSQPLLVRAVFCEKSPGRMKAVFELSENVKVTNDAVVQSVKVEQSGKQCSYLVAGPEPATSVRWIEQECLGFSQTEPWHVKITPGLESASGVALKTFGGGTTVDETLTLSTLPQTGNKCRAWRP